MATEGWASRLKKRRHKGKSMYGKQRDQVDQNKTINTPIKRPSQSANWSTGYNYNSSGNRRGY